jgi:cyclohexadienyl dehydratase
MKALYFLILFLLSSCATVSKNQYSLLDKIKERGVLVVGMTGDYAPFSHQDKKTKDFEGIDVVLANDLANSLGVKLRLYKTSWRSLVPDLKAGKYDVALSGISKNLKRQQDGMFSTGYVRYGKQPIARCAEVKRYSSIKKINKPSVRVVVNPGGSNDKFAHTNLSKANIRVFKDNRDIFKEIIAGRADVMVTDSIEVAYQSHLNKGVLCPATEKTFTNSEIAVYMQRDVFLKEYVNTWLHLLFIKGDLERIKSQFIKR